MLHNLGSAGVRLRLELGLGVRFKSELYNLRIQVAQHNFEIMQIDKSCTLHNDDAESRFVKLKVIVVYSNQ